MSLKYLEKVQIFLFLMNRHHTIGFYEDASDWRLCFANVTNRLFYFVDPYKAKKQDVNNKFQLRNAFAAKKSNSVLF